MKAESVVEAINIAKARRNIEKPLVIHSDYAEFGIVAIVECSLQVKNIKK